MIFIFNDLDILLLLCFSPESELLTKCKEYKFQWGTGQIAGNEQIITRLAFVVCIIAPKDIYTLISGVCEYGKGSLLL